MILVLIAAAVVSGIVGSLSDTIAIVVIVVLNAALGFTQELRAQRALAALRRLAAATAGVVRDGRRCTVPAADLVPGDVVVLEAGSIVPADLRVIEAAQLRVSEAALTGESVPVEKAVDPVEDDAAPVGERTSMAFKGTTVTYGRGLGLVTATGMATELGRLAGMIEAADSGKTPLQRRLAHFGRRLALAVLGICAIIFVVGVTRGEPALLMFLTAISLAVAAVPEALPAVVTILLALGARRLADRDALIRRLPAVETLGSVTFICADKTGTLTLNDMHAEEIVAADGTTWTADGADTGPWPDLFTALALNQDAAEGEDGDLIGDPTEVAVYRAALKAGYARPALEQKLPRIAELPFDSERKLMTTFHCRGEGVLGVTKGASETVLARCTRAHGAPGDAVFDRDQWTARAEAMGARGLRVIAVAQRHWDRLPDEPGPERAERELALLGLVGLIDPPRPEARAAVDTCRAAGITPVMITGDHPATAAAIARRLGILEDGDGTLTGKELESLPEPALARRVRDVRLYARVDPAQKIRIVRALQAAGEFVAMTGDGVNDAPALKQADIGVAMGKGGTDVAREAASLVLLDDNFATIVAAVREGRRIFDNIRKFIKYTMTSNAAEVWTIFLAPLLGLPVPLLPIHILWINLVTDGLPGLALAAEPIDRDAMKRPPRPPTQSIFAHGLWQHMIWVGILMAGVTLATQAYALGTGSESWQTMVFTVLTLSQMGHVLAVRSEHDSLFRQGLLSNRPLLGAVALTFALQAVTVYVPVLNPIFHTVPLSASELALCLALSSVVFFAVEAEKALVRRGVIYRE
jgi:Ca2+-transporting ATPase